MSLLMFTPSYLSDLVYATEQIIRRDPYPFVSPPKQANTCCLSTARALLQLFLEKSVDEGLRQFKPENGIGSCAEIYQNTEMSRTKFQSLLSPLSRPEDHLVFYIGIFGAHELVIEKFGELKQQGIVATNFIVYQSFYGLYNPRQWLLIPEPLCDADSNEMRQLYGLGKILDSKGIELFIHSICKDASPTRNIFMKEFSVKNEVLLSNLKLELSAVSAIINTVKARIISGITHFKQESTAAVSSLSALIAIKK